jgi:hypothetical protein
LGSVTPIAKRTGTGETLIVGTTAAVFLPAKDGAAHVVQFKEPAGDARLVEWPGGQARFVDRGGGGWQTGALIGADGSRVWQPEPGFGVDDLAAGDVDGDGVPEFVVGYNGGGGVRLLDAAGKERWRKGDANVWHVEVVDTDGDGKAEIVHSNAAGAMTVRDATGAVLRSARAGSHFAYFSHFSVVQWPPQRTGLLRATDAAAEVLGFDGSVRVHLDAPDVTSLSEARGVAARLDGRDTFAVSVVDSRWDRTQLFVFDQAGVLRYREVFAGKCPAVAAPEEGAFLFGCGARVLRYTTQRPNP